MKRTSLTALLLCISLLFPLATAVAGGFTGHLDEWSDVNRDLTTVQNNLDTLLAAQDDHALLIYIEGDQLNEENLVFYLDTGSTPFGYLTPFWGSTGQIDFKIEQGLLYSYEGTGFSETWDLVGPVTSQRSNNGLELQIGFEQLSLATPRVIRVGAYMSGSSLLPEGDVAMLTVEPSAEETPVEPIIDVIVDGIANEWEGITPVATATSTQTELRTYLADSHLYLLITGETGEFKDIFLNTDEQANTGHQSWIWPHMGADYLIENGLLFASLGAEWAWEEIAEIPWVESGTGPTQIIEIALPLELLNRDPQSEINLSFSSASIHLPGEGSHPITISPRVSDEISWLANSSEAISSGKAFTLEAVRTESKLFTRVSGENLNARNTYFIASGQSATGYKQEIWPDSAIDYMVKESMLYKYNGSEGSDQWEQIQPVQTYISADVVLMSLDLNLLESWDPSGLMIAYTNDSMLSIPERGESMMSITKNLPDEKDPHAFYPTEIHDVLNNPYMGWVPLASAGSANQPHRLVYAGLSWRELEPERGQFAWEEIEEKYLFDYWQKRGVKFVIRILLDTPTSGVATLDIPDWLYELTGEAGTWYHTSEIGNGFSPDYNNPVLIAEHERLVAAVAERYDDNPLIAFVQLGSLGHWGEWHTWPSGSGVFPEIPTSDIYVQHYLDHFTNTMIGMRRPFAIAKENKLGLFNDVFGVKSSTDEWVGWFTNGRSELEPAMEDFWHHAYSGGEFAHGNALMHLVDDKIADTLRQARESHTSWLGPCSPAGVGVGSPEQANLDALLKTIGYRFVLESVKHSGEASAGDPLKVVMQWNNKGVAPFYFTWPLALALSDADGNVASITKTHIDIRQWLPGVSTVDANLYVPSNLPAGVYQLLVAIIDPETNKPGVDLAIAGQRADGWYPLNTVTVLER